jgi:hypothetical protein
MKKISIKFLIHASQIICLFVFVANHAKAQELPKPNHQNTFFIMPLFEDIRNSAFSEMDIRREMDKMIVQLGEGNLYHQMGSGGIYGGYTMTERACRLSKEKGLRLGIILGTQTHTNPGYFPTINQDIRGYQWRLNGKDWYYSAGQTDGDVLYPGELRDSGVYSPSRLCIGVRNKLMGQISTSAGEVLRLMKEYPGVISVTNAIIEEELATGGQGNDGFLGDYSPYAITEYRDWLRHKGIYDDFTGTNKGEGAQAAIVGTFLTVNGVLTSQFADDPTPADANATGVSFNTFFGTSFTTWTNKYYDLVAYPNAIPFPSSGKVSDFNPTPTSGNGFTSGGFDAPRVRNASYNFWNSWSYDVFDHGGVYPVGNPTNPAFGFRQQMVKNYIKDVFKAYADAGLPTETMYPHQIPGEVITAGRLRSGADPAWTGYLAASGNTGITRFGYINPSVLTQYSNSWGIFEWHPLPNASPTSSTLYNTATSHLNTYYQNSCHVLFPGWWRYNKDIIFPLPDSKFADAIKDFANARKEQPYTRQEQTVPSYTPPQVQNVEVLSLDASTDMVRWPQEIWNEYPETWGMWSKSGLFEVEESTDNASWTPVKSTYAFSAVLNNRISGTNYFYRVRATTKTGGLKGAWSAVSPSAHQLNLTPDLATVPPSDPEIVDNVTIRLTDQSGNLNSVTSYAPGGFFSRLDANSTKFTTEFTNDNQAEYPSDVKLILNDGIAKDLNDEVTVKFTPPIGKTIDAVTFNYYANYNNTIVDLQILDDANQIVWENDAFGVTSGYRGVHFPTTSTYFTIRLKMKQSSSSGVNWFSQLSGFKVIYTNKPAKTANFATATVTGVGIALNTLPSNYAQATALLPLESSTEVSISNMLTNVTYANGVFSASTSGGNDPYVYFNLPQALNGQTNPYVYFRIYASQAIPNAQFFWFKPGATSTTFVLAQGWNVIKLTNLPEFVNATNISKVRLDFGSLIGAIIKVKVDWIVVSAQPYSESLVSLLEIKNGEAILPTSPTGTVGTYRVNASYNGASNFADINVNNTGLPIKLKSFDAVKSNSEVKLTWITSSEINNDYFKIEKSNDGKLFENFATVKSKYSNSKADLVYSLTDTKPFAGTNYYRLKQFDFDGTDESLGIRAVNFTLENNQALSVYPNPSYGELNFKIESVATLFNISLYDLSGRLVHFEQIKRSNENSTFKVMIPTFLMSGEYILKVQGKGFSANKKIVYYKN